MNAITGFLTGRLVAFLIPWIVQGINYLGHYVDTSKWDAPSIASWIVAAVGSLLTLWMAHRKAENEKGVKAIQEKINGSVVPITVKVDGVAALDGETVEGLKVILASAARDQVAISGKEMTPAAQAAINPNRKG